MSLYSISLFLHIVGALLLFAALGLEWAACFGVRRAASTSQAQEWVRLQGSARLVGGPAALLLLLTGIHMSATQWGPQGWIIVGLAGMVVLAVLTVALRRRASGIIVRTALFLGIIFVMSTKPGAVAALASLGMALALGLAALPVWVGSRARARIEAGSR